MTMEQISLMQKQAVKRYTREIITLANLIAVGGGVAMSGDPKPLRNLERKLSGKGHGVADSLHDDLRKMLRAKQVDVK
jgi:hypothetical protein